ncbi:hypothetical protein [Jannaschia seohaensis]|uniref:Uncharacterized protein n=1 Tax=Jannaschia seohaensis TaxID=475081 RepID=A0A2Y9B6V4_9RHOB|nr:hypothetical protein [Jannaschia seohaensis]PWJ12125.1 hypothetical protein BCF38_11760 [Jannaschia seohaensis]SSA51228.1 hypothetical protein SAMN05421539_11760 [Jannaschia seohaensis]
MILVLPPYPPSPAPPPTGYAEERALFDAQLRRAKRRRLERMRLALARWVAGRPGLGRRPARILPL